MTKQQDEVLDELMEHLKTAILENNPSTIQAVYEALLKEELFDHAQSIKEQFHIIA